MFKLMKNETQKELTENEIEGRLKVLLRDLNHFTRSLPKDKYKIEVSQIEDINAIRMKLIKTTTIPYIFTPVV